MTAPQRHTYQMADEATMQRIRDLAAQHGSRGLHESMLGTKPLTTVSAERVLARLSPPDEEPAEQGSWEPTLAGTPGKAAWHPARTRPAHVEDASGNPLCGAPRQNPPRQPARASGLSFKQLAEQVPEGCYATPLTGSPSGNDFAFWQIDKGSGRWEGYTFVSQIVGGHEPRSIKDFRQAQGILAQIVELGIDEASANYGRLMRECGFCHIPLTKRDSRYNGRGAKCSENHGLPYEPAPADWVDPGEES